MGQRSQIYIRTNDKYNNKNLVALYFQWNYGQYMISRARHTLEYIKENDYVLYDIPYLKKVAEINFDIKSVVGSQDIIKEQLQYGTNKNDFNDRVFKWQDNNDGQLFIDIKERENNEGKIAKTIKYCFTDYDFNYLGNGKKYLKFDYEDWETSEYLDEEYKEITKNNLKWLENIEVMSENELKEMIEDDYGDIYKKAKENYLAEIRYTLQNNGDMLKSCLEELIKKDNLGYDLKKIIKGLESRLEE